jgi:hypothetical protein
MNKQKKKKVVIIKEKRKKKKFGVLCRLIDLFRVNNFNTKNRYFGLVKTN